MPTARKAPKQKKRVAFRTRGEAEAALKNTLEAERRSAVARRKPHRVEAPLDPKPTDV